MCDNFLKGLFVGLNTLLFKQLNLRKVIVEVSAVLCAALTQEQYFGFLLLSKPKIVRYVITRVKGYVI